MIMHRKVTALLPFESPLGERCTIASSARSVVTSRVNRLRVGLVSKENRRRTLVVLFNFAQAQGWLRKNEETAADARGAYKIMQREVEIYTRAEIRLLLSTAEPDFLPYIVLICFGVVGRDELHEALSCSAIDFRRGLGTVSGSIAKPW